MADNLKPPAGAVPPAAPGSKVQPKKETVRISLPPKPAAKETVRLELPPRAAAGAAPAPVAPPKPAAPAAPAPPAAPKPPAPVAPKPPAPAAPAAPAAPVGGASGAKQTVRLSLPPKPSAAKETVRLELPPKPGAKAPAPAGGKEIKLIVPQADESAASAKIPESAEAEVPTMDSGQAQPAKPAGGLKGGPPGAAKAFGPTMPGKVAQDPGTGLPDSTNSAMALPAKKALPKPEVASASSGAAVVGGVRIRWFDWILATLALGAAIGAVVMVFLRAQ